MKVKTSIKKLLRAKVYRQEDVSQWMVSEKLDGVRGIWNSEKLHFRSEKWGFMLRNCLQKIFLLNNGR